MNVTLVDYTPIEKVDGNPWVSAQLYEAAAEGGPFTLIDTFHFTDIDVDPRNPTSRSFSSDNASLPNGWYKIVWQDQDLRQSETPAVQNVSSTLDYQPLVIDIARKISSRTVDSTGRKIGTFTAATSPTNEQVEEYSRSAANDLSLWIGDVIPTRLIPQAVDLAATFGAMLVELNEFGEQVVSGRSPYAQLKVLYDERLPKLVEAVSRAEIEDGKDDTTDIGSNMAQFSFPEPSNDIPLSPQGRVGWKTRW